MDVRNGFIFSCDYATTPIFLPIMVDTPSKLNTFVKISAHSFMFFVNVLNIICAFIFYVLSINSKNAKNNIILLENKQIQ